MYRVACTPERIPSPSPPPDPPVTIRLSNFGPCWPLIPASLSPRYDQALKSWAVLNVEELCNDVIVLDSDILIPPLLPTRPSSFGPY